ncbi:MAG: AtpZ/AtpI family protein [Agathobacter sp.]|nr:AtpZ/AtpI family protein [Agathobacter sp.]MBQ3558498.1 AtpZ/AtpI family protein [Agathobacter sp.]
MKKVNMREITESFSMVLQFGINMLVPIVMCIAVGVWIGDKYNMDWIVIPLFFVGALAGYTSIFKMVKQYLKKTEKKTKKEQDVKKN